MNFKQYTTAKNKLRDLNEAIQYRQNFINRNYNKPKFRLMMLHFKREILKYQQLAKHLNNAINDYEDRFCRLFDIDVFFYQINK